MDNNKKTILKALEIHKGIVSAACRAVDMPRSTFYKWCSEDEEFKAEVDDIQEVAIDYVESKLFEKIDGVMVEGKGDEAVYSVPPSDTAIIFYLKTKAKKRGYVEKTEVAHSGKLGVMLIEGEQDERDQPIED